MAAGTTLDSRLTKRCSGWLGGWCIDSKTILHVKDVGNECVYKYSVYLWFFKQINCFCDCVFCTHMENGKNRQWKSQCPMFDLRPDLEPGKWKMALRPLSERQLAAFWVLGCKNRSINFICTVLKHIKTHTRTSHNQRKKEPKWPPKQSKSAMYRTRQLRL